MTDKDDKGSSEIDQTNKPDGAPDFDAYKFWLKQQRLRKELEEKAMHDSKKDTVAQKSRLK